MTILIVDDDPGIRQLLSVFLNHKGFTAASAANGQEALEYLQSNPELPDLILLDLMMPVMDGATFRHTQRADPALAGIPVVVISAAENIAVQAPTLTADAYVPKPIDFDRLAEVIEQYTGNTRAHGV
jgi:CheY-like chemotaxis protein